MDVLSCLRWLASILGRYLALIYASPKRIDQLPFYFSMLYDLLALRGVVRWSELVPAQNERAGRSRSSRTRQANRYLNAALVQATQASGRSKNNYLAAHYRRLAARRGKKRVAGQLFP